MMTTLEPKGKDTCPKCGKIRTLYTTNAHCFYCNNDFDIGMKNL